MTMRSSRQSVLVTGGLGFVGSNVARQLVSDYDVVILDWANPCDTDEGLAFLKNPNITIHQGDIAGESFRTISFRGKRCPSEEIRADWKSIEECEFVLHAAAQVSAVASIDDPLRDFKTNVMGTLNVAEYAKAHSARVIFCNSIRVYDPDAATRATLSEAGSVSESCDTVDLANKPQPPFSLSKYAAERYLQWYARLHGVRVISHRMSGVVGSRQTGSQSHGWVTHLVNCAVAGRTFTLFGDGSQSRDILHVDDLVDLIRMELTSFDDFIDERFGVFNVGGGPSNRRSINQIVDLLRDEHGLDLKVVKHSPRPDEPLHYASNIDRICSRGWSPRRTNPVEIVKEMVDWRRGVEANG